MKNLKYGIEIEFTGITREAAAQIVADFFHTSFFYEGGPLKERFIGDEEGGIWKVVSDASIMAYAEEEQCELVTPILEYQQLHILQQLVSLLFEAGGRVNRSCGVHIHVDGRNFTPQAVVNLVALIGSREKLLYKALGIPKDRMRYCKRINDELVWMIRKKHPKNMEELKQFWYQESPYEDSDGKYHSTRYHGLNLHSLFYRGSVEFRLFNATLDSDELTAYIQFTLALCSRAIDCKKAVVKKSRTDNEKYIFRCFLLRLGLIGEEYKTCRQVLTRNLTGDSAWREYW